MLPDSASIMIWKYQSIRGLTKPQQKCATRDKEPRDSSNVRVFLKQMRENGSFFIKHVDKPTTVMTGSLLNKSMILSF